VAEDSVTRYDVRMAPKNVLGLERPDSLPREEGISPSAISTPETTTLVTPVSGNMRHMSIKEDSPTPNASRQKRGVSQESGNVEEDVQQKKRARVAFA
jgi:hypothetical protein